MDGCKHIFWKVGLTQGQCCPSKAPAVLHVVITAGALVMAEQRRHPTFEHMLCHP